MVNIVEARKINYFVEPLKLTALIHPFVQDFLNYERSLISELMSGIGSPLHFIFPQIIEKNISAFKEVFQERSVDYQILYAHKTNKSHTFLEICSKNDIGIDVASFQELTRALAHGFSGKNISISGVSKELRLLVLAIQHNCLLHIDSVSELDFLINFLRDLRQAKKVRILLRWCPENKKHSRFGLFDHEIQLCFSHLKKFSSFIDFQGFAFHLSGYDLEERAKGILHLLKLIDEAKEQELHCKMIDIGGGIPIQYLSQFDWKCFTKKNHSNLYHGKKEFREFYPYYSMTTGSDFLAQLLDYIDPVEKISIANLLKLKSITLIIEPGRSLVDQGGISLFSIRDIKERHDYEIITVDGMSFSLSEQWFNSEFLPDPVLLRHDTETKTQPIAACVAGTSCLDSDMLTWRKIHFPCTPKRGDFLAYINTAGYQMDSNESEFHLIPVPKKISVYEKDHEVKWKLDEIFTQVNLM